MPDIPGGGYLPDHEEPYVYHPKTPEEMEEARRKYQEKQRNDRRYDREKRLKKAALFICWFAVTAVIGWNLTDIVGFIEDRINGKPLSVTQGSVQEGYVPPVAEPDMPEEHQSPVQTAVQEPAAAPVAEPVPKQNGTWHLSTKPHEFTTETLIELRDDEILCNFHDYIAVGGSLDSDLMITTEADYGFTLQILDDDYVYVDTYNHTDTDIYPVSLMAELYTGDKGSNERALSYTINGYRNCPDGVGQVYVTFSSGEVLTAAIFKENDRLYAANISDKNRSTANVQQRQDIARMMTEKGITLEDGVCLTDIYYPIVPVAEGETTDTDYWIQKSGELVKPEWTDAHKIMAFYNYIIHNMAYDDWILSQNSHGRCLFYNDYSGSQYISHTNVGICEDFAEIFSIMCRAQGIPSFLLANDTHGVSASYVKELDRFVLVDPTGDVMHNAGQEDPSQWTDANSTHYRHLDYIGTNAYTRIKIGNTADMKKQGLDSIYY